MQTDSSTLFPLIVGYGFAGIILTTAALTVASLFGWVKVAYPEQQKILFRVLVVQSCLALVGYFTKWLNFDPVGAATNIQRLSIYDYWFSFNKDWIPSIPKPSHFPNSYSYTEQNLVGSLKYSPKWNVFEETSRTKDFPLYRHFFRPVAVDPDYLTIFDDSRNFALRMPVRDGEAFLSGNWPKSGFTLFHTVRVKNAPD
jgi:hypothetical protein